MAITKQRKIAIVGSRSVGKSHCRLGLTTHGTGDPFVVLTQKQQCLRRSADEDWRRELLHVPAWAVFSWPVVICALQQQHARVFVFLTSSATGRQP